VIASVRGVTDYFEDARRRPAGVVRAPRPDVFGLGVADMMRVTAERAGRRS
jgi:hypothetical protein